MKIRKALASSKAIGKPSAGILINGVEENLCGAEKTDDWSGRAKRFKIFWEKLFP